MIFTTKNKAATFSAQLVITGAPIANDADPNTLGGGGDGSVAALGARVFRVSPGILMTPGTAIYGFAIDGTSVTARLWWYDDTIKIWIPNGTTGVATTTTTNVISSIVGSMPGCKYHYQVTATAGNPTKFVVFSR